MEDLQQFFLTTYRVLLNYYGHQKWWPAETGFEVVVGAILTQNTSWSNVERAIINLKSTTALTPKSIFEIEHEKLKESIRPAGFFNQKADRLKGISKFILDELGGDIKNLSKLDLEVARNNLLSIKGVGDETADSILLYAVEMPSFVIDKYTIRMFGRVGVKGVKGYQSWRRLFMDNLPVDIGIYKEYHALIVEHSKNFCRSKPLCEDCPMENYCKKLF
ncbi:MAG: endonuclease III domain-containing protein [Deferribacterales bacterium]